MPYEITELKHFFILMWETKE